MTTASRLVDEITGEVVHLNVDYNDPCHCCGPIYTSSLDIGWPTPRAVGYNNPNANGFTDQTKFWGERAIAWSGYISPTADHPYPAVTVDKLRGMSAPNRRPWIYYQEDGWPTERRMQLRGDTLSNPWTREFGPVLAVGITWKSADGGAQESAELKRQSITPSGFATGGTCFTDASICFDEFCGPEFTEGYVGTATRIFNDGNVIVYPDIIFTGAVTDPLIENLTTDQKIKLTGSIAENANIVVDTLNRTVRENDDPNLNRLNMFDYNESNWLYLVPGLNRIGFQFAALNGGYCIMTMRDRWI